jgi:hypothetical protein
MSTEQTKQWRKEYYVANRDAILARQRQRRKDRPEVYKERERRQKQGAYAIRRDVVLSYNREWRANNYLRSLLSNARARAKRAGIEFDLTISDVVIPTQCPMLETELIIPTGGQVSAHGPSLDRKDSTKGYVKDNVWVISWRANKLKGDGTLEEFRRLVANWPVAG